MLLSKYDSENENRQLNEENGTIKNEDNQTGIFTVIIILMHILIIVFH